MSVTGCVQPPSTATLWHTNLFLIQVKHGIKANGFSTLKHGGKKKDHHSRKEKINTARDKYNIKKS